MFRNFNCGELNLEKVGTTVILSGWVQKSRNLGNVLFIDLRDRYGITQLKFEQKMFSFLIKLKILAENMYLKLLEKLWKEKVKTKT